MRNFMAIIVNIILLPLALAYDLLRLVAGKTDKTPRVEIDVTDLTFYTYNVMGEL